MNFSRKVAILLAVSFFCLGLSATSGYAQGRHWHHDNGRHLGWYKHNRERSVYYGRGTTYYGTYPQTYYPNTYTYAYPQTYYYPRTTYSSRTYRYDPYTGQTYVYRTYRPRRVYRRRSGVAAVVSTLLRGY